MGWGTGAYGSSPWGTGAGSAVHVNRAVALGDRLVQVSLSAPPLAGHPTVLGDALDPKTWQVTRHDTGADLAVLHVDQVDAATFNLVTLFPLASWFVTHTVNATALLDPSAQPIQAPTTADFPGLLADVDEDDSARAAAKQQASTDLANPPFEDLRGGAGGTLVALAGGDYGNVSGADLVRKMIVRRLTTAEGGFFHLPKFGFGLQVKTGLNPAQMPVLQKAIQDSVLLEPEVEAASVLLDLNAAGYLSIQISAKEKNKSEPVTVLLAVQL